MEGEFRLPDGDAVAFNWKCVFLSLFFAGFYWWAPPKNKWLLVLILYVTYLALAWYDHLYDCRRNPLRPTFLYSFYGPLKPRAYRRAYADWKPATKRLVAGVDACIALLLLLALPFFLRWRPGWSC
jgi:hypothetical protein